MEMNVSRFLTMTGFLCWMTAAVHSAVAQTSAFTYQGRLNTGGNPANGLYDLTFSLFNTNGVKLSQNLTNNAVLVANGSFNTTLDFGSGPFLGQNLLLEIAVGTNGSGSFTTLAPRQALTPAPYAIYATASGYSAAAGLASNLTSSVVSTFNGLQGAVTLAPGTNVTITPSGNTLTIASAGAGGSGIWSVNANNTYYNSGSVGIGTASPSGKLTVATADDTNPGLISAFDSRHTVIGSPSSGLGFSYSSTLGAGYITALSPNVAWRHLVLQAQTLSFKASGGANGNALTILNNGNVGIDTPAPGARLDVRGDVKLGSNGGLFAAAGEENLRILRGTIGQFGSIDAGSGYTVNHAGTGIYRITLNTAFLGIPTVVATPIISGVNLTAFYNGTYIQISSFVDGTFTLTDTRFNFIAIGAR